MMETLKKTMLQAAEGTCGRTKVRQNTEQKRTKWWNEEVKNKVKEQKVVWKKFL